MEQRSGFVSFGSSQSDLEGLICASAQQSNTTWTAAEGAEGGDLVAFYFAAPLSAFLASERVIRRSEETWGEEKKPVAVVSMIRMFPEPVTLRRAKERLALPGLKTPQGFAKRRQENVALLLALSGA